MALPLPLNKVISSSFAFATVPRAAAIAITRMVLIVIRCQKSIPQSTRLVPSRILLPLTCRLLPLLLRKRRSRFARSNCRPTPFLSSRHTCPYFSIHSVFAFHRSRIYNGAGGTDGNFSHRVLRWSTSPLGRTLQSFNRFGQAITFCNKHRNNLFCLHITGS